MTEYRATTRRTQAALTDIRRIQAQVDWLAGHLGDLDVIAHSPPPADSERVATSRQVHTSGPVLSEVWQPVLRDQVREACRILAHAAKTLTVARVRLEATFAPGGHSVAAEPMRDAITKDELADAHRAKARRTAHEGDLRWCEWEAPHAGPQPQANYRGGK